MIAHVLRVSGTKRFGIFFVNALPVGGNMRLLLRPTFFALFTQPGLALKILRGLFPMAFRTRERSVAIVGGGAITRAPFALCAGPLSARDTLSALYDATGSIVHKLRELLFFPAFDTGF